MSAGREFHVCGAATENARRASSVRTLGTVSSAQIISVLKHHMANQCTQFQVSIFSRFGDILRGNKNLNGSRDHNHAPFSDDILSVCCD